MIKIQLNHKFLTRCFNIKELLINCNKLSTYCNRLENQSKLFPDRYDPNKYKGDGFELLCESIIKLNPYNILLISLINEVS